MMLAESPSEVDAGGLSTKVEQVRATMRALTWASAFAELRVLNGRVMLLVHGYLNRRRAEAGEVVDLIKAVSALLPGSYGLLYELDEEVETEDGRAAFSVTVIKRGGCFGASDPFLSPTIPTIEDP